MTFFMATKTISVAKVKSKKSVPGIEWFIMSYTSKMVLVKNWVIANVVHKHPRAATSTRVGGW